MDLAPDFDEFIADLTARGVEFVIIGAYALAFHGAPRFTGDLDILRHGVYFLGRESFLRNKRAAGRPKDLADIDALEHGQDR